MGPTTIESPDPQHQFAQLEGLGEVVVGPELEPGGLVVEPVGRGEHQDRHAAARRHDAPGHLVARGAGDVTVEHRQVIGVQPQHLERRVAVAGDVRGDRLEPQPVADRLRHERFVLHHQHSHPGDPTNDCVSAT
jgi:hypothetical protein